MEKPDTMKQITRLTSLTFLILGLTLTASAQLVTTPRPSPAAELKQTLGLTEITVNYSRPQVVVDDNDRTGHIWGELVPYGMQKVAFACQCEIPWRAGANENTTFETTADILVEGERLPAGKYGLHMIVHENDRATVIFSHNSSSWGSFWYDEKEDALRVDIETAEIPFTNVLTYQWVDFAKDGGTLVLDWEHKRFPIRVQVDMKDQVIGSLANELRGQAGFTWQGPMFAAQYLLANDLAFDQAMTWIERSIATNANPQNMAVQAALQSKTGAEEAAAETARKVGDRADINQLNQIGYQMLQAGMPELAVIYFRRNVEKHPEDANVYDSLGEGLMALGKEDEAVECFQTSLRKDPPENVRQNSLKNLKKLGVQ